MPRYTPKSNESLNTSASSTRNSGGIFYRNTFVQVPRYDRIRHQNGVSCSSEVQKRVLSAKRLQLKSYQNEILDAHQIISKLSIENRILRSQIKRQDAELAKYISTNAELPRLLHSHEEEIRILNEKFRNLFKTKQEIENKLKQKESLILSLSDQNKFYSRLNKDKQLEERARLTEKLNASKVLLQAKEDEIKLTNRKLQLDEKKWKQLLQVEQKKVKDISILLEKTRIELSNHHKFEEVNLPRCSTVSTFNTSKNCEKLCMPNGIEKFPVKTTGSGFLDVETPKKHSEKEILNNALTKTDGALNPLTHIDIMRDFKPSSESNRRDKAMKSPNTESITINENSDNEDQLTYFNRNKSIVDNTLSEIINIKKNDESNFNNSFSNKNDVEIVCLRAEIPFNKTDDEVDGISKMKKQFSKDSVERETFLDAFCRQASRITLEACTKPNNACNTSSCISSTHNCKKQTLLAALKAIDDNKIMD